MPRAKFTILQALPSAVVILDNRTGISLTNDAEAVVAEIVAMYGPGPRIFYRDTCHHWDELKHDGAAFTGFSPIALADDPELANYCAMLHAMTDPTVDPDKEGVIRDGHGRLIARKGQWGWSPVRVDESLEISPANRTAPGSFEAGSSVLQQGGGV